MWTRFALALGVMAAGALGCSRDGDDPPADVGDPTALGHTLTLQQLQDPGSKDALKIDPPASCAQSFSTPITLDGVTINWVDRYDELNNGSQLGNLYIQDYQSTAPWSGTSVFSPSFVPSSLYVAAGDVVDLRGLYQVNVCIGSNVDFTDNGGRVAQIATPTATFRFDGARTDAVDVDPADFNSFETGRKWIGMLVRFNNVSVSGDPTGTGRISVALDQAPTIPLSNEFQDISMVKRGKKYASVTGVVTWFYNFKLATRTPEDIVEAAAP